MPPRGAPGIPRHHQGAHNTTTATPTAIRPIRTQHVHVGLRRAHSAVGVVLGMLWSFFVCFTRPLGVSRTYQIIMRVPRIPQLPHQRPTTQYAHPARRHVPVGLCYPYAAVGAALGVLWSLFWLYRALPGAPTRCPGCAAQRLTNGRRAQILKARGSPAMAN